MASMTPHLTLPRGRVSRNPLDIGGVGRRGLRGLEPQLPQQVVERAPLDDAPQVAAMSLHERGPLDREVGDEPAPAGAMELILDGHPLPVGAREPAAYPAGVALHALAGEDGVARAREPPPVGARDQPAHEPDQLVALARRAIRPVRAQAPARDVRAVERALGEAIEPRGPGARDAHEQALHGAHRARLGW